VGHTHEDTISLFIYFIFVPSPCFPAIRYFALLKLKNSSESWEIILRWRCWKAGKSGKM